MNCRLKAARLPRCKDVGSNRSSQPGGPRGPADDGKRLELSEFALDVAFATVAS